MIDSTEGVDIYDSLCEINEKLITPLTDEEWEEHIEKGSRNIELVYDKEDELVITCDGNPFRFVWEEVAFIFDPKCTCNRVIGGKYAYKRTHRIEL